MAKFIQQEIPQSKISNANIVTDRQRAKDCTLSPEDTDPI